MGNKLVISTPSSSLSSLKGAVSSSSDPSRKLELLKSLYPSDRQVKFLHLEAEVETLLIELQTIQQRRMASASPLEDNEQESN